MNTTTITNEGLTSKPIPMVTSYAGGRQIITLNLGIQEEEADKARTTTEAPMPTTEETDATTYQCTTLSLTSDRKMEAYDVIGAITKASLFTTLDATFLTAFAQAFGITDYDTLTATLIRGKYTYAEELSCHRKALLGNLQPLEDLNAYVEQCKALAVQCLPKNEA